MTQEEKPEKKQQAGRMSGSLMRTHEDTQTGQEEKAIEIK